MKLTLTPLDHDAWTVRSESKGRVRIFHPGLSDSPGIRRNCASILHRTHWLIAHRINVVSSTVVIRFPEDQKVHLLLILKRCFIDPFSDSAFESSLVQENQFIDISDNRSFRNAIRNGAICASVLVLDALWVVPPFAMATAATLLSLSLFKEFVVQARGVLFSKEPSRLLPESSLELALSLTLISSGLSSESILDRFLSDSTTALQSVSENTDGRSVEFLNLIDRLKSSIKIFCLTDQGEVIIPLGEVKPGSLYHLSQSHHVFLHSKIVSGELIVVNNLLNGSPLPFKLLPGDVLQFGASVLQGSATCEVIQSFENSDSLVLHDSLFTDSSDKNNIPLYSALYQKIAPPIQLGFGLYSLYLGLTERAIGFLSFNPFVESERSKISSAETALVDMAINKVHIYDARALIALSEVDKLLISINAVRHVCSLNWREEILVSAYRAGDLIQILYSIAESMNADLSDVFWGILTEYDGNALDVYSVEMDVSNNNDQSYFYNVQLAEMGSIVIKFSRLVLSTDPLFIDYRVIIEFSQNGQAFGQLHLDWSTGEVLSNTIKQLSSLGIDVEFIGLPRLNREDEAVYRASKVVEFQRQSFNVAYLGDVIVDISAMSQANVAIGMSDDENGFVSKTVCDVILGNDILWLSRLVALGRNFKAAVSFNSKLITVSSIMLTIASLAARFTPLQTIALFNLAPIIAELNTIKSLNSSSSRNFK